jgi:hypothetical protein
MFATATRVLRLALVSRRSATASQAEEPLLDFVAYARECTLTGSLLLTADRLTDLLNGSDEVDLVDALCLGLDGGVASQDRVVVRRADLLAVKAGDPRGNPAYRHRTRQVPVIAGAGGYLIHGYIHCRPGADPMIHLGRRPPMVPLTDATISYETGRGWQRDDASTLIINRDAADWIRPAKEHELVRIGRESGAA